MSNQYTLTPHEQITLKQITDLEKELGHIWLHQKSIVCSHVYTLQSMKKKGILEDKWVNGIRYWRRCI